MEIVIAMSLMIVLWSGIGVTAYQFWFWDSGAQAYEDERTPKQRAFDDAFSEFEFGSGEESEQALAVLQVRASDLDGDDPRQVDLAVAKASLLLAPQRRARMEHLLAQGEDGHSYSIRSIADEVLHDVYVESLNVLPKQRVAVLQAAIDHVAKLTPKAYPGTNDARIRVAEAVDQSGDKVRALRMLNELKARLADDKECRCGLRSVIRAQAWFHMSYQEGSEALAVLETIAVRRSFQEREGILVDRLRMGAIGGRSRGGGSGTDATCDL